MFTLTSNKLVRRTVQLSIAAVVLATASVSAQADEMSVSHTLNALEQNMTQASQEMISTAKQEFMLSLQTQIAQQVFEINSSFAEVTFAEPELNKTAIAGQTAENK
ncbi:hypothetical protein [Shewanella litoralis]|uniref:Uncharacterized protein n=1 Tax=Shewanella litoralis TaxID=2282700 RepID=A0ABQ2R1B8_9GAMM|nr:hypothetical protein [Shewanella litoralis]GGQ08765.1 hypothetical protein GCM10009411_06920 [Shewanella litoralis]